jgi:hypothetical protein
MSSHRMPVHFTKAGRASKKSSSHTPSGSPSPPSSEFADTRSLSPFVVVATPQPTIEPAPPSVPPPEIDIKTSPLLRSKPARTRITRVMKPAAIPRASSARHPGMGRPSKACLFCRHRKLACNKHETSKDSCQCVYMLLRCRFSLRLIISTLTNGKMSVIIEHAYFVA